MRTENLSIARPQGITNYLILRNTYFLLSLTLLFSAAIAGYAVVSQAKPVGLILLLVGMFGLYYITVALRNSVWGILAVFAYTGFMGYVLGPILNFYLHHYTNGSQLIMTALGMTGFIFLGLSSYVLVTRKDFSYLGGFIAAAAMVAFLVGLGGIFFHIAMLQLLIAGAFAVISSALILYTTSQIINGGETNYIMATISIYIAIFNLFTSLLQLLGVFGGNRE